MAKTTDKNKTKEEKIVEKMKEALVKIKEVVDKQNPGFDKDIPEQKQRWLR